ncbi:MAG TPA: GDSL-type esterase/lipase family protein [Verrucomicrobiae bacterium]
MLAAVLFALILPLSAHAADTLWLRTTDVIAFVGGEDVAAMQQVGYVELLLARDTVAKKLRFRNLGWEGDTVFEQKRDLNFPSWEQTLAKIGATVIVAQFGQAESLRGRETLPQFREAAEKLFRRLAGTSRLVIILAPTPFDKPPGAFPDLTTNNASLALYSNELKRLCQTNGWRFLDPWKGSFLPPTSITRDGLHLNAEGHARVAVSFAAHLSELRPTPQFTRDAKTGAISHPDTEQLRQAILAKNRLWFDYWRPQNWAFLAGDRTEQPSSRDHRDPKIRWFPSEMEKFLPLIEAKEGEILELAGKLR